MKTEAEEIALALNVLTGALDDADAQRVLDGGVPSSPADIVARMRWSEAQKRADAIIRDPIGAAVRLAITQLGERLFESGGHALMDEVAQRVGDLQSGRQGAPLHRLRNCWKHIGGGWAS